MDDIESRYRWFYPTPGWLVLGLLVAECVLWLSERFQWFALNSHKGWTVLIAVAVVGGAMILMLMWLIASLFFRCRFQFSIRSMLMLVAAVAVSCSWLAEEMKRTREQELISQVEGASVRFDYQNDMWDGTEPPGPAWLRKLLGSEYFFAGLEEVYLNEPQVTDAQIKQLRDLHTVKSVAFGGLRITDADLTRLRGIPHVIGLGIEESHVTDAGMDELRWFPELQFLNLNPKITSAGLQHVKGLASLQALCLDETQVTDAGMECLRGLSQLRELFLGHTSISGAGLVHLGGLKQLQLLRLDHTKVTDAGLEHLKGLSQLEDLSLAGTKVTNAGLEHLQGLSRLRKLWLDSTQVTDAGVKNLQQALPKCDIRH